MAKKKFWSLDKIVSFLALGISLFTLIVFARQTSIIEKQSRLSAMPYLSIEKGNDTENNVITITLNNYGVGPAIIDSMHVSYKGKKYEMDFVDFVKEKFLVQKELNIMASASLGRGSAIPAGGERLIISLGGTRKDYLKAAGFFDKLEATHFDSQIIYHSIYDDKWRIRVSNDIPEELE